MAKQKLGRGLEAIISNGSGILKSGSTTVNLPISHIFPNPEQPRKHFSIASLEELAASIRTHGVLSPILVQKFKNGYMLIAGERRLRAAKMADQEMIPAIVKEEISLQEQAEIALIENVQREDLDPISTALAYQKLIKEFNLTQTELGERIGKNRATISNAIRLLRLPLSVQEALKTGALSPGHARALLPLSPVQQQQLIHKIQHKNLNVRQIEALAKTMQAEAISNRQQTENIKSFAQEINAKVRVVKKHPKISIEFDSFEALESFLRRFSS